MRHVDTVPRINPSDGADSCRPAVRLARTLAARGDHSERRAVLRALTAAEKHLGDAGADRPTWCAWVSEAVM
ncbi:hypothetical protein [Streptomyces herbicida]|uniref:hypothetical protein n=1 Tax=Streptomyces herbicida TaxID=3065675 RepID=UPI00292CAA71|nr:hypothetical protein [Streptomyces sp. NEAU-HV9]